MAIWGRVSEAKGPAGSCIVSKDPRFALSFTARQMAISQENGDCIVLSSVYRP